ncbi:phosphoribosyltransferase [Alkalibacterium indicireducens]|uniref:PRTase-CE domain-containing protein n=1 Tax=Alkalibacterium indicireducens TaxID=398758 RepID=A0ABP3KFK0_9LACT
MKKLTDKDIINRLTGIFEDNNWDIDDSSKITMFNRFTEYLKILNFEQQEVFLELTNSFVFYNFDTYEKILHNCLITFLDREKEFISGTGKKIVYVLPLDNMKKSTVNSSFLVAYLLKSNSIRYNNQINKITWNVVIYLEKKLIDKINLSPNKRVLLVDDFIGTGETALNAYSNYRKTKLENHKLSVLSLAGTKYAEKKLREKEVNFYFGIIAPTIHDIWNNEEKSKKIEIISQISKIRETKQDENLGYGKISSLISMIRTPNNTLPLFWEDTKKNNAPFPRL